MEHQRGSEILTPSCHLSFRHIAFRDEKQHTSTARVLTRPAEGNVLVLSLCKGFVRLMYALPGDIFYVIMHLTYTI